MPQVGISRIARLRSFASHAWIDFLASFRCLKRIDCLAHHLEFESANSLQNCQESEDLVENQEVEELLKVPHGFAPSPKNQKDILDCVQQGN